MQIAIPCRLSRTLKPHIHLEHLPFLGIPQVIQVLICRLNQALETIFLQIYCKQSGRRIQGTLGNQATLLVPILLVNYGANR